MAIYTYADFANDSILLANGKQISVEVETYIKKAEDLLVAQNNKAAYNASHPKKKESKGPGEKTKAVIALIEPIITEIPKTAAELSKECGVELTALQVANSVKYIENVVSVKVIRTTTNSKGLTAQKEYTAYMRE